MIIEPNKQDLLDLYSVKKYSAARIAKLYGFKSKKSILVRLKKYNIDIRTSRDPNDLVGMVFNDLEVIRLSHTANKTSYWLCKCKCGEEKVIQRQYLLKNAKSCGCHSKDSTIMHANVNDITGNKYGKLTAISFFKTINGHAYWDFKCDCGKVKIFCGSDVCSAKIKNCGCKFDLSGEKFGKLTVIKKDQIKNKKNSYWICNCDCGITKSIARPSLISGDIISCGCAKTYHEKLLTDIIDDIFSETEFIVESHFCPEWLYNNDTKGQQHIDIAVLNNEGVKFLIEYDGKQHFEPVRFGNITVKEAEQKLKYQKELDSRKDLLAVKNIGINIVRFNYRDKLSKKYILSKLKM